MTHTTTPHPDLGELERPTDERTTAGDGSPASDTLLWVAVAIPAMVLVTVLDLLAYAAYVDAWGWSPFAPCVAAAVLLAIGAMVAVLVDHPRRSER